MSAKKYQAAFASPKPLIKDLSLINHEAIKGKIIVLPALQQLIPPQSPEEAKQLEENLLKHGCREALLVWHTSKNTIGEEPGEEEVHVLIDGHNRYRICTARGIDFKVHLVQFDSLETAKEFMIDNQLGRRNLTPENTAYLRGLRYLQEKIERGKYDRESHKGHFVPYASEDEFIDEKSHKGQNVPYGSTAQKLAQHFKVNEKTIKRDAEYAKGMEKLDNVLRVSILNGSEKVKKEAIQALGKIDIPEKSVKDIAKIYALTESKSDDIRQEEGLGQREELEEKIRKLATGKLTKNNLQKLQNAVELLLELN